MENDRAAMLGQARPDESVVEPKSSYPLAATIVASFLLLLMIGVPAGPSGDSPGDADTAFAYRLGEMFGGAVGGVLVFWGLAYAITIRHASRRWKIASFAIVGLVSVLVSLVRIGGREQALAEDAGFVGKQLEGALRSGGGLDRPVRAGEGPISAMQAAMFNALLAERQAFERDRAASGIETILQLRLAPGAEVLRNCGRIDALAARARGIGARYASFLAVAREAGEEHIRRGTLAAADRDAFIAGARQAEGTFRQQWSMTGDWAAESASLCRLLASRPWQQRGGTVAFVSDADLAVGNRHLDRINGLAAAVERIEAEARRKALGDVEARRR
jgi:hypothetical protein